MLVGDNTSVETGEGRWGLRRPYEHVVGAALDDGDRDVFGHTYPLPREPC
ncbi:hypothetical protein SAMN04487967_1062 [Natronorubrum sediminis]|uniref:Uncharacterized protein n=1 Tax=Natronorubrum sediminis TaxID=640943 RepID=A0A1H6FRY8_9EURY|nr:hypothetical protein SAMN04487967_1062 [Natronorubrum sediminis]